MIVDPNMGFDLPVVQETPGPQYATMLNEAFTVVGAHDHSPGNGVQLTQESINITGDVTFNDFNITDVKSVRMTNNISPLSSLTDIGCTFVSGGNLFYRNTDGDSIQLTSGDSINIAALGTIGGDYGQPGVNAAVDYSDLNNTYTFTSEPDIAASISASSLVLSYPTLGSQTVSIIPDPNTVAYNINLPATLPVATGAICTMGTTGNMEYTHSLLGDYTFGGDLFFPALGAPSSPGAVMTLELYTNEARAATITGSGNAVFSSGPSLTSPTVATSMNLSYATASKILATDGSKNVVSATQTGTGTTVVMSAGPTISGSLNLSSLTASTPLALDGSKNVVNATTTGTGSTVVLADSPTFTNTGTVTLPSFTISKGQFDTGNGTAINFTRNTGAVIGSITVNWSAATTAYNTTSDIRLKTNFSDYNALALISQMNPVQYERISVPGVKEYGVIAQELYEILPQAVTPAASEDEHWMVDYSKIVGVLVKAVKELKAEIELLKN